MRMILFVGIGIVAKGKNTKDINILNILINYNGKSLPIADEIGKKDEKFIDKDGKNKRRSKISKNKMLRNLLSQYVSEYMNDTYMIKQVLFLCTGNYYRSRFAEEYFNHHAKIKKISWHSISRGLASYMDYTLNPDSMHTGAIRELERRSIVVKRKNCRPIKASYDDLHSSRNIALKKEEHKTLLEKNFPMYNGKVQYWNIDDMGKEKIEITCKKIADHVDDLLAHLASTKE